MKTFIAKEKDLQKEWYIVDAKGKTLGRLAARIATILRGKHKPIYTPHLDTGDFVVVVNADKIVLTGDKLNKKNYYRHSGYVGGLKTMSAKEMLEKKPLNLISFAVKGMLPKNTLGRKQYTKLKVYTGTSHPHEAQNPKQLEI